MRNADEIEFDEVKRGLLEPMRPSSPSGIAAIDEWGHLLRTGEVLRIANASHIFGNGNGMENCLGEGVGRTCVYARMFG